MASTHSNLDPSTGVGGFESATPPPDAPTILLVEDDDLVRRVFKRILCTCGYNVLEAGTAQDALRKAAESRCPIHLLVADMNLPQLSGLEVAKRMGEAHPECKVLMVSGTNQMLGAEKETEQPYPLLLKPFTADVFLHQIKSILGQG